MSRSLALRLLALMVLVVPPRDARAQELAVVGARVYPSPHAAPQHDATVLIEGGVIQAVGPGVVVPPGTPVLQCDGCVVLAGFWNAHVHLMEPVWAEAASQRSESLSINLERMLTARGFTTVVDLGSVPENTTALRRRIEAGEVRGPRILTAGLPLFPAGGIPYYLHELPAPLLARLPQPGTPDQAVAAVAANAAAGADVLKLFTGAYDRPGHVRPMPGDLARAAAAAAHARGQRVFAHPSDAAGVRVALARGVDVLAHAPDTVEGIDDELLAALVARGVAMVPTLQLFSQNREIGRIRQIVSTFHMRGGALLFGTDVGFLTAYDPSEEYRQLQLAGLSARDVLAMLTTAPADRFGRAAHEGRVEPGMAGDLTVLRQDPMTDGMAAFTTVRATVRGGRVVYRAP